MRVPLLTGLAVMLTLAAAGPAAAATAPSATTGPVSAVSPTSATVTGSVNPNGTTTSWRVEYGTSTSYGSSTASANAGAGTSSVGVSAGLTGLKAGTTYHYRLVATSAAGTTRGADAILTTASAPAAVTGGATSVSSSSATLNGTVDPNSRATTWYFEYGTSTGYGTRTPAKDAGSGTSTVTVAADISGLHTGRTYHYRLVAKSDAGTARGSDHTFVPTAAPSISARNASDVGDTSATLSAAVDPNGSSTSVSFDYGTSVSYGSRSASASAGSGTSARTISISIKGLQPNTTYHARATATNGSGTATGADTTFTTTGPPVAQTSTPSAITNTSAALAGSVDPNGHSTSWYAEWGTTTAYGTRSATKGVGSGTSPVTVTLPVGGLREATVYHVRIVATSGAGTSYGNDVAFTTAGPAITLSLSAPLVVEGRGVILSGAVGDRQANERVGVYAQRFGASSFVSVATVLTGPGGTWSLTVHPRIATAYKALVSGGASTVEAVAVRPAISLRAVAHHPTRLVAHVSGVRSFARRIVLVQRHRLDGGWLTIARVRLNRYSTAVFTPRLARGHWMLRVAISAEQAGAGYRAGYSRWVGYRRR